MKLQQKFLLQCMMLLWMHLLRTIGASMSIHTFTQDITGLRTITLVQSVRAFMRKDGTIMFTHQRCIIHTSTTLDFIFMDMVTGMIIEVEEMI